MRLNRLLLSVGVMASGLVLQGCEKIVHSPTKLSQNKIQLQQESFVEDMRADQMDSQYIEALARHYSLQGDGGIELSVTYDPASSVNTAMKATDEVARISETFRKNGITQVDTMILPVNGQGDVSRAYVSYNSYALAAPVDCDVMPGYEDRNIEPLADYKLGCTRDTIFAKQIARPRDLAGRGEPLETSDGRRAANIVERYRSGIPNETLEGESASE